MILVEIAGYLGADPEERTTATGKKVISLRVATRIRQGGNDETVWWKVNIWGDRFNKLVPHLKKGSSVIILGEMAKPETYTGKDGNVQVSLTITAEIIKFSPFGKSDRPEQSQRGGETRIAAVEEPYTTYAAAMEREQEAAFAGDDLPF